MQRNVFKNSNSSIEVMGFVADQLLHMLIWTVQSWWMLEPEKSTRLALFWMAVHGKRATCHVELVIIAWMPFVQTSMYNAQRSMLRQSFFQRMEEAAFILRKQLQNGTFGLGFREIFDKDYLQKNLEKRKHPW